MSDLSRATSIQMRARTKDAMAGKVRPDGCQGCQGENSEAPGQSRVPNPVSEAPADEMGRTMPLVKMRIRSCLHRHVRMRFEAALRMETMLY